MASPLLHLSHMLTNLRKIPLLLALLTILYTLPAICAPKCSLVFRSDVFTKIANGPRDGQPLIFVAEKHRFIGDHLVLSVSRLNRLHERFPNSKIYFVTPMDSLFSESNWLKALPANLTPEQITENAGRDAFWILQDGKLGFHLLKNGFSGLNLRDDWLTWNSRMMTVFESGTSRAVELEGTPDNPLNTVTKNIYDFTRMRLDFLFGKSDLSLISPEIFLPPDSQSKVDLFLKIQFSKNFDRKFVIINLNTAGETKVAHLAPNYSFLIAQLIEKVRRTNDEVNILISAPEPQFGPRVLREVRSLVEKNKSFVSFLPESKTYWEAIMQRAHSVITQDSGFMHLALVMKPASQVLGLGTTPNELSKWCAQGQLCLDYNMRAIESWLQDRMLIF